MRFNQGDKVRFKHDDVRGTITGNYQWKGGQWYWCILEVHPIRWPNQPEGIKRWAPEDQLEED